MNQNYIEFTDKTLFLDNNYNNNKPFIKLSNE
jgi:hypothetical protein